MGLAGHNQSIKKSQQQQTMKDPPPPFHSTAKIFFLVTVSVTLLVSLLWSSNSVLLRVEYPPLILPTGNDADADTDVDAAAILVTGTSRGIGRDICTFLATKYPSVHIYCGVRKLSPSPTNDNKNVHQIILDITKDQDVSEALETIQNRRHHRLVAVINNAGVIDVGTVEFTPLETWKTIIDVNVIGTVRMVQSSLPTIRQNHGRIIIVGSTAGLIAGIPRYGAYQSSKYALEAIADSLRKECLEHNVSVSLVEPGVVETDMTKVQIQTPQDLSIEELEAYPKLYNTKTNSDAVVETTTSSAGYMDFMNKFVTIPGSVDDTLGAIDHALFDKYPQPRYRTAWLGIGPSWFVVPLYKALPDRLFDWLIVHCPRLLLQILCMIFDKGDKSR